VASSTATRVVVADDSGLMRRMLSRELEQAGFAVVAVAADGDEALALCAHHKPDAMTLDLAMPGMDGLTVLRELRRPGAEPTPVVVVSAFSPAHGARAVDALAEGAFDLVAKPTAPSDLPTFALELEEKVRLAARSQRRAPAPVVTKRQARRARAHSRTTRIVVIACSTGGPRALAQLVPQLPSPLGAGTLIVQHMPSGFTASLATRLDRAGPLNVAEARGGEALDPATALVAPGGRHLHLREDGTVALGDEPPLGGLRPRADLTISDVARKFGRRTLLVVLTGMGRDGADGAAEVRARGGRVLVEAESSCAVYGMPRAIVEAGLADEVLPLDQLAAAIAAEAGA
jgi:two-component system, chemotaxis family, protein-glutamate methylesterase/glutaminase